ncbi:MAG TPA: hypothetical protein VEV44_19635 [Pseudoneobacillus sp.]|nr:hypothetical protein [Pseudoneobacillus sp.]
MNKSLKTKKLLTGAVASLFAVGLTGCNNPDLPPPPEGTDCNDYDWNDDLGVWECDDYDSRHYGHYFYGGGFYSNRSSLFQSKSYKSYKSSSSFKGGFGSSSKGGFGG